MKYSGWVDYINSLNAAIRENREEKERGGKGVDAESFRLSNDTTSMLNGKQNLSAALVEIYYKEARTWIYLTVFSELLSCSVISVVRRWVKENRKDVLQIRTLRDI